MLPSYCCSLSIGTITDAQQFGKSLHSALSNLTHFLIDATKRYHQAPLSDFKIFTPDVKSYLAKITEGSSSYKIFTSRNQKIEKIYTEIFGINITGNPVNFDYIYKWKQVLRGIPFPAFSSKSLYSTQWRHTYTILLWIDTSLQPSQPCSGIIVKLWKNVRLFTYHLT